jgi:hypothetical protein
MAETLGALCDKLTIVKLKQWHTEEPTAKESLANQENQLCEEIDLFVRDAVTGRIPHEKLTFAANKVYRREGNVVQDVIGEIGKIVAQLADVNCRLWHEQELVYEFEKVPADKKDSVIRKLALLNLERTSCIDHLDALFKNMILSSSPGRTTP